MRFSIYILLITLFLFSIHSASATTLRSPFKFTTPPVSNPKGEIYECASPGEAMVDLSIPELYDPLDPTMSIVKKDKENAYQTSVEPIHVYLDEVARMANTYVRSNSRNLSSAQCTLLWLNAWAQKDALTGEVTHQGNFVRKWALASISSSYVQIAFDSRLDAKQKITIKKWIQKLSQIVMDDYKKNGDTTRRNHRLSWAAWAVGISSVAIQNRSNFNWAIEKAKIGLIQVEDDGTLPLEVRRGARAQIYHLFAAEPLILLAELAYTNNINLYNYNKGALHRLAELNVSQLTNSIYLQQRSGTKQRIERKNLSHLLAWLEPYNRRFGFSDPKLAKKAEDALRKYRPLYNRRLGGDTTLLFEPEKFSSSKSQ